MSPANKEISGPDVVGPNDLYRQLFASADDAILILEGDRIIECNAKAQEVFACQRSDLVGHRWAHFAPLQQPDGCAPASRVGEKIQAAREGAPQRFDWTCRRNDGHAFTAEISLNAAIGGENPYIQAVVRPITAYIPLAAQLRRDAQFLERVFETIEDGICVFNPQLEIIQANRAMITRYGRGRPLVGETCYEAFHGRSTPCEDCPTVRAIESGMAARGEMPAPWAQDPQDTVEVYAFPVLDPEGKVTAVVEFAQDISARKKAEHLLEERQQLYGTLFDNNHSVMLLINPRNGVIIDANRAACRYYGCSKSELTTLNISAINTLSKEEVFAEMGKAKAEERSYFNFRHRLANGETRNVEVYSGPITVGGKVRLCSIVHDISERKAAEAEREALITDLREALSEVKTLRGYLPICSACKRIRDDKGYWNQIEAYISDHSEAEFSHGICPQCMRNLYPEFNKEINSGNSV